MTNKLLEEALRLVCNDVAYSLSEVFEEDNSLTIHHRNIQKLAI